MSVYPIYDRLEWKRHDIPYENQKAVLGRMGERDIVNEVSLKECKMVYLFFIAAIKNYHKLSGLNQHIFIIS